MCLPRCQIDQPTYQITPTPKPIRGSIPSTLVGTKVKAVACSSGDQHVQPPCPGGVGRTPRTNPDILVLLPIALSSLPYGKPCVCIGDVLKLAFVLPVAPVEVKLLPSVL